MEKIFKRLVLFFLMSSLSAFAAIPEQCLPPMSLDSFRTLVTKSRDQYFPELQGVNIVVTTFRSDAYFLQAQPEIKSLMGNKTKRNYEIQLNLKLLDCPPSEEALVAILVHEIEHIKDYTGWSAARLLKHGVHYSASLKLKTRYERATDHKVLDKGLHHGLAGYREWVYQWLTPKDLARKKKIYLTPEEINTRN